jgi:hypothetical protein
MWKENIQDEGEKNIQNLKKGKEGSIFNYLR